MSLHTGQETQIKERPPGNAEEDVGVPRGLRLDYITLPSLEYNVGRQIFQNVFPVARACCTLPEYDEILSRHAQEFYDRRFDKLFDWTRTHFYCSSGGRSIQQRFNV